MTRFWFEFDRLALLPAGLSVGCGVTAWNEATALELVRRRVFRGALLPPIVKRVPDIDIRELDAGHVVPNMGNPAVAGIWFPLGYDG